MTDRSLETLMDEIALGLADEAEMADLEARALDDPALAARFDFARARFAPLDETADPLPLPADFWSRVEPALDTAPAKAEDESSAPSNVVPLAPAQTALGRWRATALGSIAASLLLAVLVGWMSLMQPDPVVIAVLVNDSGEAIALVESGADNTTRVTLLEAPNVPDDQVMQVWTKPEDDGLPVSLGLLSSGTSMTFTIEGLPTPHPQQLYEITFEPAGGSPTNLPTGPILGKGLAKEPVT